MTTYVRLTWWQRVLPLVLGLLAVLATAVAVHQHLSAREWRSLERERAAVAAGQLDGLRTDLAEVRTRAEDAEQRLSELANTDAQEGDAAAQLGVLAERAATAERALGDCQLGALDLTCAEHVLEARAVLRALQRLELP